VARALHQVQQFFSQFGRARKRRARGNSVSVDIPDELDWYVWRPIVHERRITTLRELEQHHSLEDLRQMHLALDVVDDLEAAVAEAAKKQTNP
jgi:hypothetical protein